MIEDKCTLADMKAGHNITAYFGFNADGSTNFDDDREQSEPEYDKPADEFACDNCGEYLFDRDEALKHFSQAEA